MLHLRRMGLDRRKLPHRDGRDAGKRSSTEWERSERRQALARAPVESRRRRSRRCDHGARRRPAAGPHQHRHVSRGQPRARRLGHQEHGDRPVASSTQTASIGKPGPARVFTSEKAAIAAVKDTGPNGIKTGDVIVLISRGPMGSGMEETAQITIALRYLPFGKHVAILTDARFSGVSTGACIGHIGPEALAGGPIGKVRDGDLIEIVVDREQPDGQHQPGRRRGQAAHARGSARRCSQSRPPHPTSPPIPALPDDTRLWAALQQVSGGTWGGCVYDVDAIIKTLEAGRRALHEEESGCNRAGGDRDCDQPDLAI